jgi:hypothetical protein
MLTDAARQSERLPFFRRELRGTKAAIADLDTVGQ